MRCHPAIHFLAISTCLFHFTFHPGAVYAQEAVCPWPQASSHASPLEISSGVAYCPDLVYRIVGETSLMLDISYPGRGAGPFPTVILLHGCGPANKGRKGTVPLAHELARRGYVGVAVSYRCKPEDAFPASLDDIQGALRWVRAHTDECRIDKNRIGIVGFSGGGTLACLVGVTGKGLENDDRLPRGSGPVQAIISFYAPTDFARLHETCLEKSKAKGPCTVEKMQSSYIRQVLEKWLGGPPSKVPELYALASPMSQTSQNCPPMLLIHGADDAVVPVEQSQRFAKKLQKTGRPVSLLVVEGAGHDFEEKNRTDGRLAFAAVLAFLDEHLLTIKGKP